MKKMIKVLIVDDSAFMRKLITDILSNEENIEVIGTARNGEDCLTKLKTLKPDVITMDVEMPVMNGLDALKEVMALYKLPVIMLSSTTKEGASNTILAMQYGAVDFITKPSGAISLDLHKVKDEIVTKVLQSSKANITNLVKPLQTQKMSYNRRVFNSKNELDARSKVLQKPLVCIGTSTGGPRALQHVLTRLPNQFPAPILIVQHMPAGFTKSLAKRLDSICHIEVKEAENGELLKNGVAYIAPGGYHLKLKEIGTSVAIQIDESEIRNGHRPSVDVMFESVSHLSSFRKIAVIMTGMGSDGAKGLVELKKSGNTTAITESEQTSVVYGMPKVAAETNLVDEVADVDKIADVILKYIGM
ncbi:protein-glutamate methylesterase/protein-glutamine glutaminase [Litchfieldia salsa]|uniref:Protein-glutamate methylesterase/protein-glutamine glutaminase n=1 Tax=Litchfieldia salsa TaxID=930152 RepID=A0A1H0R7F0_9BACI|nr:chemotaxis response regulator protein-glutamate methylesterase [Litchfieldia salsa]SDP24898.1 two-component system, chemotaxis family, response regulator CheB [Litchfieldia salsa]